MKIDIYIYIIYIFIYIYIYIYDLIVLFSSPELIYDVAEAISYELRAQWNGNRKQGKYQTNFGLSCLSPVINIMRHPLWGRNSVNTLLRFAVSSLWGWWVHRVMVTSLA